METLNKETEEFVLRESKRNAEIVWNAGWKTGYAKARSEYGVFRDGEAVMERATKEQMEEYGDDLIGWCSRCEKPINGRWAGWISFCPWCGRPLGW